MSEMQKPVEEPVVAPTTTETPVVVEPVAEPMAEAKPVDELPVMAESATETPAVPATTEEVAAPAAMDEAKPVEEGILGYKGPGLIKSFIFQKKHFWFGTEPVESKHLSSYLRGEKPDAGNHNAAWASHTGKGLLFFSKKSSEKTSPAGVINLSEASDVTNDGTADFYFTVLSHKHTFQAANLAERDSWVSTLKTKITEAKDIKESVIGSDSYKNTHSSLSKPALAATAVGVPKKSTEAKEEKKEAKEEKKEEKKEAKEEKKEEKKEAKEEKKEAKEEKKEEKKEIKEEKKEEKAEMKEEKKEDKKARKSRSASRKRTSIFGSIGFGKKEEKVEETPAAVAPEETTAPVEPVAPVEPIAPVEESPAVTEPVAPMAPVEETKPVETKPAAAKRNSIFGTLQSRFSSPKEKKPEEAAPAVPAKDAEPVSETAPVIPAVEATEPLATSVASPATVPTETVDIPVMNGETKTEAPAVKNDKRKSSLPWLSKKEKATTSDEETEKPKSPFAKLRATVKTKKSPKAAEKPAEEVAEPAMDTEAPATEAAPATTEPVVSEPISAAPASTPQVSATA
ncbi:hypothetical protein D0Z07_2026 [Hyphodiscus hymeniophilus]|uniref:PH domain-containing protein n=1 Tax=Hyphodiscus hymeniophilus TaxID=353542 RepID=A0A9P6VQI6_9HELO|nr:hypothetical protein D0Z07_2026 [Hyphodiscus hymeniophilus]